MAKNIWWAKRQHYTGVPRGKHIWIQKKDDIYNYIHCEMIVCTNQNVKPMCKQRVVDNYPWTHLRMRFKTTIYQSFRSFTCLKSVFRQQLINNVARDAWDPSRKMRQKKLQTATIIIEIRPLFCDRATYESIPAPFEPQTSTGKRELWPFYWNICKRPNDTNIWIGQMTKNNGRGMPRVVFFTYL